MYTLLCSTIHVRSLCHHWSSPVPAAGCLCAVVVRRWGWLRPIRSSAPFCRPAPAVRGDLGRYMGLDLGLAVMRGERPRPPSYMAYWLLAAVYAFGMLGAAVAAGSPEAGMLQDVALCIPLVTAAVPLGVGVAAGAATEAAATRLSEHVVPSEEAVAASVEAWCDVFMRDFQEQHCVD